MLSPRCPKCGSLPAYTEGGSYCCMMCGRRWPVNGERQTIVITKITGGKKIMPEEIKKTSAGKKGPCAVCGKPRFIADKHGRCSTCSRAAKAGENPRSGSLANTPVPIPHKSALDMTITEVASSGMAHIIDMMQAERAAHMAEADKLGKAIALLQGL